MKISNCSPVLAIFSLMMICSAANAAYVQLAPNPQDNDGSINLPPSGFTATYSPDSDVNSIWFDANVSPQSPSNVAKTIVGQFGGSVTLVAQDENFTSGSILLTRTTGFNVLAVHIGGMGGGNELLFFFNSAITSFNVMSFSAGGSNNLSNFRAFNYVVPLPAAVWLFASALIGLTGLRRR